MEIVSIENGNDKIIIEVNFTIKIYKYFIKVSDPIIGTHNIGNITV